MKENNVVKEIREYQKLTIIEPSDVIPLLSKAADRIEKLEKALKDIAKDRQEHTIKDAAKLALKYP